MIMTPALIVDPRWLLWQTFAFNNFLAPHQRDRINVWLHPDNVTQEDHYIICCNRKWQSAQEECLGKGFFRGNLTKLNYVPEQSTAFILHDWRRAWIIGARLL